MYTRIPHCFVSAVQASDARGIPADSEGCHTEGVPKAASQVAFQQVDTLPRSTWPDTTVPQQLHLDLTVPTEAELARQHARALELGTRMLVDRSDDSVEPPYVYADPEGHPFCIFVVPDCSPLGVGPPARRTSTAVKILAFGFTTGQAEIC